MKFSKPLIFGVVGLALLSFASIIGLISDNKTLIIIGVVALYGLIALMVYGVFNLIGSLSKKVGEASVDMEGLLKQFEKEAEKIGKNRQR